MSDEGLRFNEGKPGWHLLPLDGVGEIVRVFDAGARKYAPGNWLKGMDWSNCQASLLRHIAAWSQGEDRDPETGCLHMAHAAWNALALVVYQIRGLGNDDRDKAEITRREGAAP